VTKKKAAAVIEPEAPTVDLTAEVSAALAACDEAAAEATAAPEGWDVVDTSAPDDLTQAAPPPPAAEVAAVEPEPVPQVVDPEPTAPVAPGTEGLQEVAQVAHWYPDGSSESPETHFLFRVHLRYARAACLYVLQPGTENSDPEVRCNECTAEVQRIAETAPSECDDVHAYVVETLKAECPTSKRAAGSAVTPQPKRGKRRRTSENDAHDAIVAELGASADQGDAPVKLQRTRKTATAPKAEKPAPEPKAPKAPRAPKDPNHVSVPPSERSSDMFNGVKYTSTVKEIEKTLKGKTPEKVKGWGVEVARAEWPPKQVVELVWGIDRAVINTYGSNALLRAAGLSPVNHAA
jgi:hypothetical protein